MRESINQSFLYLKINNEMLNSWFNYCLFVIRLSSSYNTPIKSFRYYPYLSLIDLLIFYLPMLRWYFFNRLRIQVVFFLWEVITLRGFIANCERLWFFAISYIISSGDWGATTFPATTCYCYFSNSCYSLYYF